MADGGADANASIRIDKLLWYLRLTKTRTLAAKLAGAGHIRLNGARVEKPHHIVRIGDQLTFSSGGEVRIIRLLAIPLRRGPAEEARGCYADLGGGSKT